MFTFDDFNRATLRTADGTAIAYLRGDVLHLDLYPRSPDAPYVVSASVPIGDDPTDAAERALGLCVEELREAARVEVLV
jgi:hypothetical protein